MVSLKIDIDVEKFSIEEIEELNKELIGELIKKSKEKSKKVFNVKRKIQRNNYSTIKNIIVSADELKEGDVIQ